MNLRKLSNAAFPHVLLGAAMSLFTFTCMAQQFETSGTGIRLSGFGTVGVVHSQAPQGWGFNRSTEQAPSNRSTRFGVDSRFGVQLNYAASSQIELVGQALATRRRAGVPATDAIEWAFAAYRPTADSTLRVGRVNLDQFLMADHRNVGFAYLYARPPVEYYGAIPGHLDGADVTQTWRSDDVRWRAKGFAGRSKAFGIPVTDVFGFALARESGGLVLRAGWARGKLARNFDGLLPLIGGLDQLRTLPIPSIAAEATVLRRALDLTTTPLNYLTLGITYEQGPWQTVAELTRIALGNSNLNTAYASLGRRIGDVTVFGLVSSSSNAAPSFAMPAWGATLAPIVGPAAAQQAQVLGATAAYAASQSIRQTTYSLGGRWDIHPRVGLKVQWDHVKIRANGGFLWSNATGDPGSANVATALLDFVF